MNKKIILVFIWLICISQYTRSQQNSNQSSILFYNVENLFDVQNNPETEDDNYTSEGELHWTTKRLNSKILNISKAILSGSGWNVPDIIVMCEVENRSVLEKLTKQTPLKTYPFKIIHKESPDFRGIDVALLYNSDRFYPLEYEYYPLVINNDTLSSREILYVSGILNGRDTIYIFGNHWPSRFSGLLETKSLRNASAKVLRSKVDDLFMKYHFPKIVIVGDFNDNPDDDAISEILNAKGMKQPLNESDLYNLFANRNTNDRGSIKYQSQWFIFDQIIVSGALLMANSGISTNPENAKILELPFLLEEDKKYGGKKPFRTYSGYTYNGGFSDHLPVILKLDYSD